MLLLNIKCTVNTRELGKSAYKPKSLKEHDEWAKRIYIIIESIWNKNIECFGLTFWDADNCQLLHTSVSAFEEADTFITIGYVL